MGALNHRVWSVRWLSGTFGPVSMFTLLNDDLDSEHCLP
jgi:hypothetical protein